MKQVLLDKVSGKIYTEELPLPILTGKGVLVETSYSVISAGTETSTISRCRQGKIAGIRRMIPEDGIVSYIKRKVRSGTLLKSTRSAMSSLSKRSEKGLGNLIPLGYSSAGIVIDKDPRVNKVDINDKVACAGTRHAELNYVGINLLTKVPPGVDLKQAAFSTLGCIAMQGVRRANVKLGEAVAVIGQGVIGQIVGQLARASGAHAIVTDLSQYRLDVAKRLGASQVVNAAKKSAVQEVLKLTNGFGVDSVIICAASSSSRPLREAIAMVRDKGRIVLVGTVKIEIPREPFYEKELDFLISRSYGPGRYDPLYEGKGLDYPLDTVRWTENRNMEEFVRLLAENKVNVRGLITHEYGISEAAKAYETIMDESQGALGVVLRYDHNDKKDDYRAGRTFTKMIQKVDESKIKTAIIGCGNFARKYHLPNLKQLSDYQLVAIVSATGLEAKEIADKNGIKYYTTDYREVLSDPDIDLVVIATRHNLHTPIAVESLKAKKHVFLEKPMCRDMEEAQQLAAEVKTSERKFTVGFNRRFSPLIIQAKRFLRDSKHPLVISYRVANTFAPSTSWIHDAEEGGGTIIGECCHFFDLLYWLLEEEPIRVFAEGGNLTHPGDRVCDNAMITLKFAGGSIATVAFTDLGLETFPKERIEVFAGEYIVVIDDFRELTIHGAKETNVVLKRRDKGHVNQFIKFADCIKHNLQPLITYRDGLRATLCGLKTLESIKTGLPQPLGTEE